MSVSYGDVVLDDGGRSVRFISAGIGVTRCLCGPIPFMRAMRSALLERGAGVRDIQYEVFGPNLWQADTD